jgi:transcriptional regulator with XRE-family HTH domain
VNTSEAITTSDTAQKTLGQSLREKRRLLGLKQHEVADRIGVVQQTYGRWENDVARPRDPEHVAALADFLEITQETVILRAFVQPAPLAGTATEKLDAILEAIHAFSAVIEDLVEHQRETAQPRGENGRGRMASGS